ncbi:FKBP-type peptidyl-prolyl cis-trans isomerase [Nocardia stercoris]|uniref:peptidylprolyl isomerase n=1 Tax=Nocardia stercoris TaxID=2483361 RepID=A0A3M2KYW6_9NOCA|nr:peptidylprolyl isomerase [Nocardia stercoris]RMI30677.1 peptidylprolyl isomerase [Nocardia stercoris]
MNVGDNTVVTARYTLTDAQNAPIETDAYLTYLHGGYGGTLPKLEEALDGKAVGDRVLVQIEPEDAFGDYDENLLRLESLAALPAPVEIGTYIERPLREDDPAGETDQFLVTDIAEGAVILDGNHPLAGLALRFDLEVTDVRPATDTELAERRVTGDTAIRLHRP